MMAKKLGGLSARESIAAAVLVRGGTKAEAARAGGFKKQSSISPSRPAGQRIGSAVTLTLDAAGATLPAASKVLADELKAKDTKFFPTLGKRNKKTGEVDVPSRDVVAHEPRLRAVDMVLRAHGAFPRDQEQPLQTGIVHEIIKEEVTLPDGTKATRRIVRFDAEE